MEHPHAATPQPLRHSAGRTIVRRHPEEQRRHEQRVLAKAPHVKADYRRIAFIAVTTAVYLLALVTTVSTRWTRSATSTGTEADPHHTEVGMFKICNCTFFDEGSTASCAARVRLFRVLQAFSVLMILVGVSGFAVFLISSFASLNPKLDIAVCVLFFVSCSFGFISVIVVAALRSNGNCGGQTFADLGVNFNWAFVIRVIESFLWLAVGLICVLRAQGKAKMWPLSFIMITVALSLGFATTSTFEWMSKPELESSKMYVGPWGICICRSVHTGCPQIKSQFTAVQVLAVIQTLLHIGQVILASFVPAWLQVHEFVLLGFVWVTWLVQLLVWSVALAAFTDCRCGYGVLQKLNWPFAVTFLSFMLQSFVAIYMTYLQGKKRILAWAVRRAGMPAELGEERDEGIEAVEEVGPARFSEQLRDSYAGGPELTAPYGADNSQPATSWAPTRFMPRIASLERGPQVLRTQL